MLSFIITYKKYLFYNRNSSKHLVKQTKSNSQLDLKMFQQMELNSFMVAVNAADAKESKVFD